MVRQIARQILTTKFLNHAALLLSVDNENKEYDRAIVELVSYTLGLGAKDHAPVEQMLRALTR